MRIQFRKYMHNLGFTDEEINKAYTKALTHSDSTDINMAEIICRDVLQGKDDYLKEKKR